MAGQTTHLLRAFIQQCLDKTGWNASRLAKEAGLSDTTLTRFMNNKTVSHDLSATTIRKVSDAAGVPVPADLQRLGFSGGRAATFEHENPTQPSQAAETTAHLPIFDLRSVDGTIGVDAEPSGMIPFETSFLKDLTKLPAKDLALVRVTGDAMETTLRDGDILMIDLTAKRIVQPAIYVLSHDGETLVKRAQRDFGTSNIRLISDNKVYPMIELSDAELVTVIGRGIYRMGNI